MVQSSRLKYRYAVDGHDVITSVSPAWLAFARENGAPELTEPAVLGHRLWEFFQGAETIRLYQALLQRVRRSVPRMVVPFRCDSPTLRRYMQLEIARQPQSSVQFEGVLERVESTERLSLLDRRFPRSGDTLTLCSCCKRALAEPQGWLEIEEAVVRLHVLEEEAPQLRHTVCPDCLATALYLINAG